MRRWRRRGTDRAGEADSAYDGLREIALSAVEAGLDHPGAEHPDVAGVVVDISMSGGFVSVVALTDGTTSMYTSVGGGIIGSGAHAAVAEANRELLNVVQAHLGMFEGRSNGTLPESGHVRFHVLTPSARRYADVTEDVFWGRTEVELTPVVASAQDLITTLRDTSPD